MSAQKTHFSIVIPTSGRSELCLRAIASCLAQKYHGLVEILVIANPENIELEENIARLNIPSNMVVQYLSSETGVGNARNKGVEAASGTYLLFLDDDCQLIDPNHLTRVELYLSNESGKGLSDVAVGGYYKSPRRSSLLGRAYNLLCQLWIYRHLLAIGGPESQHLLGGGWALRKKSLIRSTPSQNFFDSAIVFGASESELQKRLRENGTRFFVCSDLPILHSCNPTLTGWMKKAWLQAKNKRRIFPPLRRISWKQFLEASRKHGSGSDVFVFAGLLFFMAGVGIVARAVPQK